MSKIMLVLGCGDDIRPAPGPGWFMLYNDRRQFRPEVNAVWDLNRQPWPWHSDSIWMVVAQSVLEHLDLTLVESLNECWRVLRPGGELHVKLPRWDSERTWIDPTHRRGYALGVLGNFDPDSPLWAHGYRYGARPWRLLYEGPATTSIIGRLQKRPKEEGER